MNQPPGWTTRYVGTSVNRYRSLESTQAAARRLIAEGRGEGALVVAESQTAGRGRFARVWQSPPGNLYASVILRPTVSLREWPQIMMLASLALVETLDDIGVADAAIKWPNDILIGERKVAGLLSEIERMHLVLGIGVNVNAGLPSDLPQATSVRIAIGHEVELDALLQALVARMDIFYGQLLNGRRFTTDWAARMDTLGRQVQVLAGNAVVVGKVDSVDPDGALRVRQSDGTIAIFHGGEVTLASQGGKS